MEHVDLAGRRPGAVDAEDSAPDGLPDQIAAVRPKGFTFTAIEGKLLGRPQPNDFRDQARLANAGLAHDPHDLTLTLGRQRQLLGDQRQLTLASNHGQGIEGCGQLGAAYLLRAR